MPTQRTCVAGTLITETDHVTFDGAIVLVIFSLIIAVAAAVAVVWCVRFGRLLVQCTDPCAALARMRILQNERVSFPILRTRLDRGTCGCPSCPPLRPYCTEQALALFPLDLICWAPGSFSGTSKDSCATATKRFGACTRAE